jgi:Mrp family chromosome partitioning ATPase
MVWEFGLKQETAQTLAPQSSARDLSAMRSSEVVALHSVPTVGALLVDMNRLTQAQAEEVLVLHRQRGEKFGRTAVSLGYISESDLQVALARQQGLHVLFPHDRAALAPSIRDMLDDGGTYTNLQHARAQLELRWFDETSERRCLAVVSAQKGDGRSHFVACMGLLLAQQGLRVLLIDAVVNNPTLGALLGAAADGGPTKAGPSGLDRAVSPLDSVELSVLTLADAGLGVDGLYSQAFARTLSEAASQFDAVLIDTPPAAQHVEAITIATRASGAVSLVRLHRTKAHDHAALAQQLREAGVEHLGSIALR